MSLNVQFSNFHTADSENPGYANCLRLTYTTLLQTSPFAHFFTECFLFSWPVFFDVTWGPRYVRGPQFSEPPKPQYQCQWAGAPAHHKANTGSTAGSAVNRLLFSSHLPAESETRFTAAATADDLATA